MITAKLFLSLKGYAYGYTLKIGCLFLRQIIPISYRQYPPELEAKKKTGINGLDY